MEIDCGICIVRPWREIDAETIVRHANNRKVWLNLRDRFPHPDELKDAVSYISAVSGQIPATSFAVVVDGQAAGGISLHVGTDIESLSAEIGYWLGETFWGRGIMTVAVSAVTKHALQDLRLLRVFGLPFANNPASARVLEKAGYQREGVLRCSAVKAGKVQDQVVYAVVCRDGQVSNAV